MAIKTPDLLNRLPSVSELLEKPPVRALTDRWNRSAVAGRVQSFLEEVRNDLRRRASDVPPTLRELAERAARYIMTRQQESLGTAINATGQIWGGPWRGVPLSDAALERLAAVGREFLPKSPRIAAVEEAATLVGRMTGAEAAAAVHSYSAGVWLALAALAQEGEVLIARSEVDELSDSTSLLKLAKAAGVTLRDVGTTHRASEDDYASAVTQGSAAILKLVPESYRIVGDTAAPELERLSTIARQHKLVMLVAAGSAPLTKPDATFKWPLASAAESVSAGADLIILRGDGLTGGPPCGVLVGRRTLIDRVKQHPLFASQQLDPLRAAALAATLELYAASPSNLDVIPVWQLLSAPLENLRQRAERIAPQLAQSRGIASATAAETKSPIVASLDGEAGWSSFGIVLKGSNGPEALRIRLHSAVPPVIGRVEGESVVLDLRTVLPRQDVQLVSSILGADPSEGGRPDGDTAAEGPGEPSTEAAS